MKPFVLTYIKQGEVDYQSSEQIANITLYGKTEDGKSCCVEVVDYYPYFYFYPGKNFNAELLPEVKTSLEQQTYDKVSENRKKRLGSCIRELEIIKATDIMGYHENEDEFIKVTMSHPNLVTTLRGILREGTAEPINGFTTFQTYESNILFVNRWMIDKGTSGGGWLQVEDDQIDLMGVICLKEKNLVRCHYHFQVKDKNIKALKDRGDHAPITITCFDIECAGKKGKFPVPEEDPVIQIGVITEIFGNKAPERTDSRVHVLGTCAKSKAGKIESYKTERDLLLGFSSHIASLDVDFLIGYNICNFDIPYLIDRAKVLQIGKKFCNFSKRIGQMVGYDKTHFESKAHGVRESNALKNCDGIITLDMFQAIQRDYKLRSYTLNHVSKHFLGDQKADIPHNQITPMHEGDENTRAELAYYCWKDCDLPLKLFSKLMIFYNYMEMARVCLVPIDYLLERGQSIKVMTQILSAAKSRGYIVPNKDDVKGSSNNDDTYQGATVIDPERGFYTVPVMTLDFSSLYPSIMMAHNLCYSTLIKDPSKLDTLPKHIYSRTPLELKSHPRGVHFVNSEERKGVLPEILEKLIAARKKAKRELAAETDPFKKGILDGRQLALKISANSVYGFTGATIGKLPCFEISASVTAYGRQMIDITSRTVEEHFTKKNGYPADAKVIYGDTDSVMVIFGPGPDVEGMSKCMELGKQAAQMVTKKFKHPINLEFEKGYFPYLLINKKRYAAYFWSRPDRYDKLDTKGLENVRRDSSYYSRDTITQALKLLLDNPFDPEIAINYVKSQISLLVQNKIDPSRFAISKKLKPPDSYKNPQPHLSLYHKLLKRDKLTAPSVGDRIAYVIIPGTKDSKVHERAEDPLYVIMNGIGLDFNWYLEKQLKGPLERVFAPVIGEKKLPSLFEGEHTRKKVIPTNTTGIFKFCKPLPKCLKCNTTFKKKIAIEYEVSKKKKKTDNGGKQERENRVPHKNPVGDDVYPPVCENCKDHEETIVENLMKENNELHERNQWLLRNCMKCKGEEETQGIICSNVDCEFYYERYKVIKDSQGVRKDLKRFTYVELNPLDKRSIGMKDLEW